MAIDPRHDPQGHLEDELDDEGDDGASDTSSVLTEIAEDDFPSYFQERDGRLFHSHGNLPYPLPVDSPEQDRLKCQHRTLRILIGEHYVGPVAEILAPDPNRRKRVLDLGAGTGCWTVDMARQFRSARFNAIDIVPIQTRSPPRNAHFEMHDITQMLRWEACTMDVVHARSIMLAMSDYGRLLKEVARVLRPGGLFIAGEIEHGVVFEDDSQPSDGTHGIENFFSAVDNALHQRELVQNGIHVPEYLHQTRTNEGRSAFTEIHTARFRLPIGDWGSTNESERRLGLDWRAAMESYADSVAPVLLETLHDVHRVEGLVQEFKNALNINGMFSVYTAVWAFRAHSF